MGVKWQKQHLTTKVPVSAVLSRSSGQVPQLLLCVAMGPGVRHDGALPSSLRACQVEVQFCVRLTHSKIFWADSTECSASRHNDSNCKALFGCSWQKEQTQREELKKKKQKSNIWKLNFLYKKLPAAWALARPLYSLPLTGSELLVWKGSLYFCHLDRQRIDCNYITA